MKSVEEIFDSNNKNYPYPNHLIDPKRKDDKWVLAYGKAMLRDYLRKSNNIGYNARGYYEKLLQYYQGRQDISNIRDRLDPNWRENCGESWLKLDWDNAVLNIAHKFINIVVNKMGKVGYDITAKSVDKLAVDTKKDYGHKLKAYMELQKALQAIQVSLPPSMVSDDLKEIPQDVDEYEVEMNINYKTRHEMDMEMAITLVNNLNVLSQKNREMDIDMALFGIGGISVHTDSNGIPKQERVNPFNLIVSNTSSEDFKDMQHVGEILSMTISDLRQAAGSHFTDTEYAEIVEKAQGWDYNSTSSIFDRDTYYHSEEDYSYQPYDHLRIKVLKFYFYSTNEMVHEKVEKDNKVKMYRKDYYMGKSGKSKRNYKRTKYKVVYQGFWVIGTDCIYNAGLMKDMVRYKDNLADTRLPYMLYAPFLVNGKIVTLLDQIIPIVDEINLAWNKMKHELQLAIPKGARIDLTALEEVPLGKGGENISKREVLDLFFKRGIAVGRSGERGSASFIEELDNGLGSSFIQYYRTITDLITLIREILGISPIVDASTPEPRTGLGVSKLAIAGTDNVLEHFFVAKKRVNEYLAEMTGELILQTSKHKGFRLTGKALGKSTVGFFEMHPETPLHEFGIFLENRPTEYEWQDFYNAIDMSIEKGQLTIADRIFLKRIDNLKQAEATMQVRIKKREREAQAISQQQQQQNAEIQQQSAAMSEQMKQQTLQVQMQAEQAKIQAQSQARMAEITMQEEEKRKTEQLRHELALERQVKEGDVKRDIAAINALNKNKSDNYPYAQGV